MLRIENLSRNYGKVRALRDFSLHVPEGEIHGFVGPNGAGKTTTMRIAATLLSPSRGKCFVKGYDVMKNPERVRAVMGYMPDYFGVYDNLLAWEYLEFYGGCQGMRKAERRNSANELLRLVHLEDKRDAHVDALSRGMKQRLCLARCLMHDPSLVILDEPASGMDPRARVEMRDILRSLKDMGKTVLISSHILPELAELCDAVTIIGHGELIASGSMEEIQRRVAGKANLSIAVDGELSPVVLALKQTLGVNEVMQDGAHALEVDFTGDDCELLRALCAQGHRIRAFGRRKMNLEQVFLEVTANELEPHHS